MLPKRLEDGDLIHVIALASPPCQTALERGIQLLESIGLRVEIGTHTADVSGYLAGTDADRVADFHASIANRNVKAILFACGGYGSGRIAPLLDYRLIRQNPKILWGYSDMTYIFAALHQFAGSTCFHGPMVASDFGKSDDPLALLTGLNQLFVPQTLVLQHSDSLPLEVLSGGEAEGELVGGNLSIITSTLGTPFEMNAKDKIILIEDVNEEPYRIDSMLQQLTYAGKFADAAGVIVGDFASAEPTGPRPSFTLEEVLDEYLAALPIPVMKGFPIGHCDPQQPVPLGVNAVISTSRRRVEIAPGVC